MIGLPWRRGVVALLLAVSAAAQGSEPPPPAGPFLGRGVAEVLQEMRGPGLDFIYSSELLPDTLRVSSEPAPASRLLVAREILAPHGLTLRAVRPGIFAVVRDPNAREASASGSGDADGASIAPARLTPLAEVVVSTSRFALDGSSAIGSVRVQGDTLALQPVLGEDAIRALGRLPGLAQNGISAQSNIRGGETGEVLVLLDDFPIRQPFHHPAYNNAFGVLDPGLIADAEVFTGGFPVRYGNRMAGVFDFSTIESDDPSRRALGLSVFNAMARNGGELDSIPIDWLAMARVSTLRTALDAFADDVGRPSGADVYARVGYGDSDRVRLTANFLWARDELDIRRDALGEDATLESRSRYLWLRADHAWSPELLGSLWLGFSDVSGFRTGTMDKPGIATGAVEDRRSSEYHELRGRMAWQPAPRHWLEGGFELTEEDADYRYSSVAQYTPAVAEFFARDPGLAREEILAPGRERVAVFASHRWQIAGSLVSELGLRAQRTSTQDTTEDEWIYDPRLSLRWELAPATELRAHWGRFHQTDEVHELKVEDGLTEFPEAQRTDQFIVGVDHQLSNGPALRLEWFRKSQTEPRARFENLLDPMALLPEIAPDRVVVAPRSAEVRGSELSARHAWDTFNWWASVAWSEVRDDVDGRHVPRSWDQNWAVTAGIDWLRGDWRFGAVANSHQGWPTTRVDETGLGERNAARFTTRAALDLRAEYRRALQVGSLTVTLEVTNAVNVGNTCCYELIPVVDGDGNTTFTTRSSDWLPVVPSVGVLWEF